MIAAVFADDCGAGYAKNVRTEYLALRKAYSALIVIDFCVRHGFVDEAEPGYAELVRAVRRQRLQLDLDVLRVRRRL